MGDSRTSRNTDEYRSASIILPGYNSSKDIPVASTIAMERTVMKIIAYTGTPFKFVLESFSGITPSLESEKITLEAFVPRDTVAVKKEFITMIRRTTKGIIPRPENQFL